MAVGKKCPKDIFRWPEIFLKYDPAYFLLLSINVTDEMGMRTGPLVWLSLFSIIDWIRPRTSVWKSPFITLGPK